jgi:hypothetical protein
MHVIWVWAKRWLLMAIGLPVAAWLLDRFASSWESTRGQTGVTDKMHGAADWIRERRQGRRGRRRHTARSRTA